MSPFVLFVNADDFLRLLSVAPGVDRVAAAKRVAPEGRPFWLVEQSELPPMEYYDAWRVDVAKVREPDGYGEADV